MEPNDAVACAKLHIDEIRSLRVIQDIDKKSSIPAMLMRSLDLIAKELYQKTTHFLLELIQNADDNHFEVDVPTLSLTYRHRVLRVDCNETGLKPENVDAICSVADSSKVGSDKPGRYIGQKGIGFKSVFKAADLVWISSGPYSFKFDKTKPLGMITPIWDDFPGEVSSDVTSFHLQMAEDYNDEELIKDLCAIDSRILIFLKRLKCINVSVTRKDGTISEKHLRRLNEVTDDAGFLRLAEDGRPIEYYVTRHTVKERKSPNHPPSEMVLAFPSSLGSSEVGLEPQQAYAFLPIRSYGFTFLLQGNFSLTANREDINSSDPWNKTLEEHLRKSYAASIKAISSTSANYLWPLYLPLENSLDFFWGFRHSLLDNLSGEPIVESYSGSLSKPGSLVYVPDGFLGPDGVPLTLSTHTESKYLSPHYRKETLPALEKLKVRRLGFGEFLEDLSWLVDKQPLEFQIKDPSWHVKLAKVLLPEVHHPTMQKLPIIPLRTGEWVPAGRNPILFSENDGNVKVPGGIRVSVVESGAEADPTRRQLFVGLGVKSFDTKTICQLIPQLHSSRANIDALPPADLISHAQFLYDSNWDVSQGPEIWFVAEDGKRQLGPSLYLDADPSDEHSATCLFARRRHKVAFLHGNYNLQYQSRLMEWKTWLTTFFKLSTIPRIASGPSIDGFGLSYDFKSLFDDFPSSRILLLLRDKWKDYCYWIAGAGDGKSNPTLAQSRENLISEMAAIPVSCMDGKKHPLRNTSLPNIDSKLPSAVTFSLDITDEKNGDWRLLSEFGVFTERDVRFYLQCLENMSWSDASTADILHVYEQIQVRKHDMNQKLRDSFKERTLVYMPATETTTFQWIKARDCVWNTSNDQRFSSVHSVGQYYPSCKALFCEIFGVRDNEIDIYLLEAGNIGVGSRLSEIAALFHRISRVLRWDQSAATADAVRSLSKDKIFPIQIEEDGPAFHHLSAANEAQNWYIADSIGIRRSFHKKISLLAFEAEDIAEMDVFLGFLNLAHLKLSSLATEVATPLGRLWKRQDYTDGLVDKTEFIARLIPRLHRSREKLYRMLCNIQVYEATKVEQVWTFDADGVKLRGRGIGARVASTVEGDSLFIFMMEHDIIASSPPYELVEKMSEICGIRDPKHVGLLGSALSLPNQRERSDLFRRQNIPEDTDFLKFVKERVKTTQRHPPLNRAGIGSEAPDGPRAHAAAREIVPKVQPLPNQPRENAQTAPEMKLPQENETNSNIRWQRRDLPKRTIVLDRADDERDSETDSGDRGRSKRSGMYQASAKDRNGRAARSGSRQPSDDGHPTSSDSGNEYVPEVLGSERQKERSTTRSCPNWESGNIEPASSKDESYATSASSAPQSEDESVPQVLKWETSVAHPEKFQLQSKFRKLHNIAGQEHSDSTLFLGELITSNFLKRRLKGYDALQHWTSPLRERAGYPSFSDRHAKHAAFTLDKRSPEANDLFIKYGYANARQWADKPPQYHLEVTTTAGERESTFLLSVAQLERARTYKLPTDPDKRPRHVLVLVKISRVHSNIDFRFYVDPWEHYLSDSMRLRRTQIVEAEMIAKAPKREYLAPPSPPRTGFRGWLVRQNDDTATRQLDHHSSLSVLDCSRSFRKRDEKRPSVYQYRRLEGSASMRLLNILPGPANSKLKGLVHHVRLDSVESYIALSYAWGSQGLTKSLGTPEGQIRITPTLHSALTKLREKERQVTVWVDGICINQSDNGEKAQQIDLMANIFNSAAQVVAYLGEEEDDCGLALQTLMQVKFRASAPKTWPSFLPEVPQSWGDGYIPAAKDAVWNMIKALFNRLWFRRAWVIQEAVVAAKITVVCGAWAIEWNDLVMAVENCDRDIKTGGEEYQSHVDMFNSFRVLVKRREDFGKNDGWAMLSLLDFFRYVQATRQRDRLFALLNLAADKTEDPGFRQDYDSPFEAIVIRYGKAFVKQGRTLTMLYHAGLSSKRPLLETEDPDRFPSWIPDWTIERRETLFESISRGVPKAPDTGRELRVRSQDGRSDELLIGALQVDEISFISTESNLPLRTREYLEEVARTIRKHQGDAWDLCWRVPIADAQFPPIGYSGIGDLENSYVMLMRSFKSDRGAREQIDSKGTFQGGDDGGLNAHRRGHAPSIEECPSQDYLNALQGGAFLGWRFVVTRRGCFGIASRCAEVGDSICIFGRSEVFFLLRNSDKREGAHRLIGDCYIHGVDLEYFDEASECEVRLH